MRARKEQPKRYRLDQPVRGDYRGRAGDVLDFALAAGEHDAEPPAAAELLDHLATLGLAELIAPAKRPAKGE